MYNLEIDGEHNFIANGIVTHNSDEIAAWRYLQETWDMAMFGLRLGQNPKHIITTTPRPVGIIKELVKGAVPAEEMGDNSVAEVVITRGSSMDNAANLSPNFIENLMKKYEGTRLGRQEIYAEILDDNPGALFQQSNIDMGRVELLKGTPRAGHEVTLRYTLARGDDGPNEFKTVFREIVVAIDPSMSSDLTSDKTGMIVMALDDRNHIYALEDMTGLHTPNDWARIAIEAYHRYNANAVVAEINQGGDLVEHNIRTAEADYDYRPLVYRKVRAKRGKWARAEPVGALEEQGRIHHVGDFPKLEDELTGYTPGHEASPDRLDAYVWGAYHLVVS
ncbi:MAG: terminase family protein, partial [Actinobacteria bacterium]|nr:terminase family protein [Actinomycetota bacterium]